MTNASSLRERLALGAAAAALIFAAPVYAADPAPAPGADQPAAGTLVVTAQRKSEIIERTPVAVSAFTGDALKIQRLDGGENLELAVPNMNYSRTNFRADYSLEIRGIGAAVVGDEAEPGDQHQRKQPAAGKQPLRRHRLLRHPAGRGGARAGRHPVRPQRHGGRGEHHHQQAQQRF